MTYYIGFGLNCYVADLMKDGGFKNYSFPFDWMFAFPCDIKNSLDKDFSDWLDLKYLTRLDHEMGHFSTKHDLYDEHTKAMNESVNYTLTHAFFNHHDLTSKEDREIFERRIQRYKNVISSSEDVVFITNCSVDSFKEVELLDYYKDREAKTTILFLDRNPDEKIDPELKKYENYYVLEYGDPDFPAGVDFATKICKKIEENFGKPILNDPINLI